MASAKKEKSLTVRIISLIAVAIIILAGIFIEPPEGLDVPAFRCLCIVVSAFILWLTEALPVAITCILLIPAFALLGVLAPTDIYASAASSGLFFLLAGFGLGAAILKTNFAYILLRFAMKIANGDSKKIISGFVIMTGIVSMLVNNAASVLCFLGLAVAIVKAIGDPAPGTSNFAKGLMLALPMGAACGGVATPASNGLNVVLNDLLGTATGLNIPFLQWCQLGIPLSILLLIFVAWWLPKGIRPESLSEEQLVSVNEMFDSIPNKLEAKDWKCLAIFAIMIILWIASNWIKAIDVTLVAILAVGVFFLPGINILTGKDYMSNVKPLGMIMILCIMPLAKAVKTTGAADWIVNVVFSSADTWSSIMLLFMITLMAMIVHLLVPSGTSNGTLCGTLMIPVAFAAGLPCTAVVLILAAMCGNNYITPVEGLYSFTYAYGHFGFKDCAKVGIIITAVMFLLCWLMIPALASLLGMF